MGGFRVVPATATVAPRQYMASQDRALAFGTGLLGGAGVVVCDGVGSLPGSGSTAELAAGAVRSFMATQDDLVEAVDDSIAVAAEAVRDDEEGATTMLVLAADPMGSVGYGMVGNGAIVEVMAVEPVDGTWRLHHIDLGFPHIGYELGRPSLQSFLPTNDPGGSTESGARRLRPDRHRLFLACSDGLVTEDAPLVLRDDRHGGLWRQVPTRLAAVLADLAEKWAALIAGPSPELELPLLLQSSLTALADSGEVEDDATLACLLLLAESPEEER